MSSGKRLQTEATQMHPKGFCAWGSSLSDHCARWTRLICATWLVYSEVNMITNLLSSVHTLFAFSYRDWPVRVIFSQIKTQFKDLSATDLVRSGKWKAHADRRITGLSAGAHRGHCSPCTLAFSLLAAVASSPWAALKVYTLVFGLDIKSFILWCLWTAL